MTKKRLFVLVSVAIILLVIVVVARTKNKTQKGVASAAPVSTSAPLKTVTIAKDFSFSNLSYTLTTAELRSQIILQGQTATAAPGRIFLILNLKLRNDSNNRMQIVTSDFIRLNVNGSNDWLAPEINNDPVEVQPISTKYTRLGFPINISDKDYKLQVGEIKGTKTATPITF